MAKFMAELPDDVLKDVAKIYNNTEHIFGEMTKAGAQVALNNMRNNMPQAIRSSNMASNLKLTRIYKTPSDGGINTKVAFYGYFTNKEGKVLPAPYIAAIFEYGRSNLPFPKQPFVRKSFAPGQIERAMKAKQKEVSGGLLE